MNPGSDMSCGAASRVTASSPPASDSRMPRRVRSASAPNSASRASSEYLTIGFSIHRAARRCQAPARAPWARYFLKNASVRSQASFAAAAL